VAKTASGPSSGGGARVAKHARRGLDPSFFHMAVAHQDLIGFPAEVANTLQHDPSLPQLLRQPSIKLSAPERQNQVQATLRSTHA
jgi:hypothetical protein